MKKFSIAKKISLTLPYGELECINMFPFKLNSLAIGSEVTESDFLVWIISPMKKKLGRKFLINIYFNLKADSCIPDHTHLRKPSAESKPFARVSCGATYVTTMCSVCVSCNWWKCPM